MYKRRHCTVLPIYTISSLRATLDRNSLLVTHQNH